MADWTELPKDLLELISKHLETSTELLRFRSVCTSWRSSVSTKPRQLSGPFRILPNDGICCASFGFSLFKRTIFLVGLPNSGDRTDPRVWVVKTEEDVPDRMHLLNPLSRCQLNSLPSSLPRVLNLINFRLCELGQEYVLHHVNYKPNSTSYSDVDTFYMEKVVIIWENDESEFVLLTIHVSGKLAMFKSGDKKWTIINVMPCPYDDVMVYKGNFYAVDNTGRTVVVGLNAEVELVANPVFGGDKKYLVASRGELLLVDMYLPIDTGEASVSIGEEFMEHLAQYMSETTVRFKVFKLDEDGQSWIELKSLGDRVLFLGDDSTFSASASDLFGCKGNCIFFADNFFYPRADPTEEDDGVLVGNDIGVFELESGCTGRLRNCPEYSKMFWPPPHWATSTSAE